MKVLQDVSVYIQKIETEYEGAKEFYIARIHNVLKNKKPITAILKERGEVSQAIIVSDNRANLAYESWYAYEDNYGTSEEKNL
ncbi:hypothetical protein [Facklamia lactis]|uniref:hypothetical protein n=1 Tax=Facklamia lactis TaxID=2749967 RepID=UPI0018CD74C4|nr:hypothetical protein [Facklamia lactis]